MIEKTEFFKHYNISEVDFKNTQLKWKDLTKIHSDYSLLTDHLETIARHIHDTLQKNTKVHSTRLRVKNPDHLVEKIIRKRINQPDREINLGNFMQQISDLVGVRALHLFKSDWIDIDKYIKDKFRLYVAPVAYIREGDSHRIRELYKKNDCKIEVHPYGYRSVHYLVVMPFDSKTDISCEIQVRTVFEEGWSEIDHRLRYPYDISNSILQEYLSILNGLAGNADNMGTFILYFLQTWKEQDKEKEELKSALANLQMRFDELMPKTDAWKKMHERIDSILSLFSSRSTSNELDFNTMVRSSLYDASVLDHSTFLSEGTKVCSDCGAKLHLFDFPHDGRCLQCRSYDSDLPKKCDSCGKPYHADPFVPDFGLCSECINNNR